MKVKYKEKEVELQYSMMTELLFMEVTKRSYNPESIMDNFYLFWCALQIAYGEPITYEEVSQYIDNNSQIFADWINWLADFFSKMEPMKKE